MKNAKALLVLVLLVSMLATSCQIEKRRYRKGFNVGKNAKNEKSAVKDNGKSNDAVVASTPEPVKTTPVTQPTTTTQAPKATAPANKGNEKVNTEYSFTVKIGPRPDKKGPKKYPMGLR